MFTRSRDQTVRAWDAVTGTELEKIVVPGTLYCMDFSPDARLVVTGSQDGGVRLWDVKTGALLRTMSWYAGSRARAVVPVEASFSPDGRRVVTGTITDVGHSDLVLWDIGSGTAVAVLQGHTGLIRSVAFSPDGTRVVSAAWDRMARIWQFDPLVSIPAKERQDYVCDERLVGAQSFTDAEMQSSLLRGREYLRNPCDRVGSLSLEYYRRFAANLIRILGEKFAKLEHQ